MSLDTALSRRGFCVGAVCAALAGGIARAQAEGVTSQVLARGRADYAEALGGPAEVITGQVTVAPGTTIPWHTHPGPVTAVINKGELSIYGADGCKTVFAAGDAALVALGTVHFERNEGAEPVEFVATYVVPPGSPLRVDAPPSTATCAL